MVNRARCSTLKQQDESRLIELRFTQPYRTELDHYVADLRGGKDCALRNNFKTKMDFIADARF